MPESNTHQPQSPCPTPQELEHFLANELEPGAQAAIAEHLAQCRICQQQTALDADEACLEDDIRSAARLEQQTAIDVNVPLGRLNELLDEYQVVREIGRGGMGIVYEARQRSLNRVVALKVMPALLGVVRPNAVARFRREAELAARLKHTNIVSVYDYGEVDGTLYYAMELVHGQSLSEILAEIRSTGAIRLVVGGDRAAKGDTPATRIGTSAAADRAYFRKVAQWMADVAAALAHIHESGVLHRDIKPSNLLLADDGRLMIADFGLAHRPDAPTITASRSLLGTLRYMSPEQLADPPVDLDARNDVYGLGATLYELLALRPMFTGGDDRDLANRVLHQEPAPPRRFVRHVPRELETICLKAVEKDRAARYATAQDLADDLGRWLLGLPIAARRSSAPARAWKYARRRKAVVTTTGLAIVFLLSTGLVYSSYLRTDREAAASAKLATAQAERLAAIDVRELRDGGRYGAALSRVEEALIAHPESLELQTLRAEMFAWLGHTGRAIELYEEIIARSPDYWPPHLLIAHEYAGFPATDDRRSYKGADSFWSGVTREARNAKAAYHLAELERLMPKSAEAFYMRSKLETDHEKALEWLSQADALEPDRVDVIMARAKRLSQLKRYDAMLTLAIKAVAQRPGWASAHELHARALRDLGCVEESVEAYTRAIQLNPAIASYWHNRGWQRAKMGRYEEAIADANEALQRDEKYVYAYAARANYYERVGKPDLALADCERAIQLDPTDLNGYKQRAYIFATLGQVDDAIREFGRLIEMAPNDVTGYQNRAVLYRQLGQHERAIADVTRYIELLPDDARGYRTRALEHESLAKARGQRGQLEVALADMSRAIELEPLATDYDRRGDYCLRLGRYREAISDYTRLVESGSDNAGTGLLKRGAVYELLDAASLALDDYAQAATGNGSHAEYALLWRYLLLRRIGEVDAADSVYSGSKPNAVHSAWVAHLFELAGGDIDADELLARAATSDERAEANYYVGMMALIEERLADARSAFQSCIDANRHELLETELAFARLDKLNSASPQANAAAAP